MFSEYRKLRPIINFAILVHTVLVQVTRTVFVRKPPKIILLVKYVESTTDQPKIKSVYEKNVLIENINFYVRVFCISIQ